MLIKFQAILLVASLGFMNLASQCATSPSPSGGGKKCADLSLSECSAESSRCDLGYVNDCVDKGSVLMAPQNCVDITNIARCDETLVKSGSICKTSFDQSKCGILGPARAVSVGLRYACAIRRDKTVSCWGKNDLGQATVPTSLGKVIALSAGGNHACTIQEDGSPVCWGDSSFGATVIPGGIGKISQVSAGFGATTCVVKDDKTASCWGNNNYDQATVPGGLGTAKIVSTGYQHSCGIKIDGTVACWGRDNRGQTTVPVGLGDVTALAAGPYFNCALKGTTVVCWGSNSRGQTTVPADVGPASAISAGVSTACAIRQGDGNPVCWGEVAATPAAIGPVVNISTNGDGLGVDSNICAVKWDGTIVCWSSGKTIFNPIPDEFSHP